MSCCLYDVYHPCLHITLLIKCHCHIKTGAAGAVGAAGAAGAAGAVKTTKTIQIGHFIFPIQIIQVGFT